MEGIVKLTGSVSGSSEMPHELSEPSVLNWWLFYCCQLRITGDGVCTRWKKSQQVCHTHVSGGNGLLVPAVAGQGFPVQWAAIGVLGSLLFGLLTYLITCISKSERTVVRRHGESNS